MALYHVTHGGLAPVEATTFDELQVRERADLQRLLRSELDVIAPDCMLLAEEFSSWDDSRRRIDLLAIDRDANLVVIELKRTEDGGHGELQALRYAAMVSMMSFEHAVNAYAQSRRGDIAPEEARQELLRFLDWEESETDQFPTDIRIVLVSANFSKEVTSTVMWLNDRDLDIRCVRLRPHRFANEVIVDVQQILPLPEAAEYQVRMRERNEARREAAARASDRDLTKFDIAIDGVVEHRVNKRKAILKVVRALVQSGVTPEEMMRTVPERGDRFFASVAGDLTAADFAAAVTEERERTGRVFDVGRWFCEDDELLHLHGRTYAVSNQWGTATEDVIRRLLASFPDRGVKVVATEA